MSQDPESLIKHIEEHMKLPRENGEIIFQNPWESRVFAMAVLLSELGKYPWKAFNSEFVNEIKNAEIQHPGTDVVAGYYQNWAHAFEKILLEHKLLTQEQLEKRTDEFSTGLRHHVC